MSGFTINHLTEVARRKVGAPSEWEVFAWEMIGDTNDFVVTGGIPRLLTRGPRKGQKTWDGPSQKAVVTQSELHAEHARYELATGKCGDCFGSGEVFAGWSVSEGTRMKSCRRCGGSGNQPKAVEEQQA